MSRVGVNFENYHITASHAARDGFLTLDLRCKTCRAPVHTSIDDEPEIGGHHVLDLIRRHELEGHAASESIYPDDMSQIFIEINVNDRTFDVVCNVPVVEWREWDDESRAAWARAKCSEAWRDATSISWRDARDSADPHLDRDDPDDWPTWYDWKTGMITRT